MLHRAVTLTLLLSLLPVVLPATGIPIVGRILGPDGEPKPKVEVHVEAILSTYERARLRLLGRPGPDPVARVRTSTDGTFELSVAEAGMWKVVAAAPGLLTMEYRLIPLANAAVLPDVELARATDLEVRLVDVEGKPRPGTVGAYTFGIHGNAWRPQLRLATAGEDGLTRLPVGHDEKIHLEVLADGHPLVVSEVFDESSVTIEVPAGVAGTVRVIGRQKRPVAEAVAFQGSALLPLGLTDDDGLLPLVLQVKEPQTLQVMTAARWNGSFDLDLDAANGEVQDLRLDPPVTISGRVLDLSNRDPVADALVWAHRGEAAVTDEQGRYALEVGVFKTRWVRAAATGYETGHSQTEDFNGGEAPTIALTPSAELSGKVMDERGGLLKGVAIELRLLPKGGRIPLTAYRFMREGWRSRTSHRGAFRVAGLPVGISYQLTFTAEGFAPQTLAVEPLEARESRSGLEVVLKPGRLAVGLVVDENDVPVAGAEVRLKAPPPTNDLMAAMWMSRQTEDEHNDPPHFTDAEGRFEIADLAVGSYDLEVRATGFAPAKIPGVRVPEDQEGVDFGTVGLIPGASIEGRVTDPDGAAVDGAEVKVDLGQEGFMVVSPSGPLGQAKTDAEGRFIVVDLLPNQQVTLAVTKRGYGSESVSDLRPPIDEPLAIVLRPAGRLKGKVVDQQGDPIQDATVMVQPDPNAMMLTRQGHFSASAQTSADGSFLIEDVEPGTLQATVGADRYQQQVRSGVEVAAGTEVELDFALKVGAVIVGTVTTATGEPVVQANIQVSEQRDGLIAGNRISAGAQTDVEGRYRVTGAPTGLATMAVYHDNNQRLAKSLEVQPGTNTVDLVLEPGFEVTGQVVTADGTPMSGAAVSIQEARLPGFNHFAFHSSQAVSAAGGAFTLSGVRAGKYVVTASQEGYAPARSDTFEVSGDVTGLLLELRRGATLKGRILGLELDELGTLVLNAYSQEGGMRRGKVDFSAEYAFESLAPGQWHVQAQVGGSGRSSAVQVEIPEGVTEVEKDIELDAGFTLTGIVLDGGQPLVGANIASSSATSAGMGTTGADGRFKIQNLKAGSYQVIVMSGMALQHTEAIELVGDHDLRIEISTGAIAGTVLAADNGEPLAGAAIALERLDASEGSLLDRQLGFGNRVESDSRGYFQVPRVRQGSWRVVATKSGYAPGEVTVVAAGGSVQEVEIRMVATEGVSFGVVLESGTTVPTVQVVILDPSGRRLTDGSYSVVDGKVRVSTVPPGRWELVIQGGDSAATRFAVSSPGDQGQVVLRTGGTLHIKVPELEQEPMASVILTGPDGNPFVATMGLAFAPGEWLMSGGQSMIQSLTPGVWTFTVKHADGRTWSGSAAVTPGGTTEVSLP